MRTLLSRIAFRMKGARRASICSPVDDDWVMRTAPLGVANGAVVGVVPGCPSG